MRALLIAAAIVAAAPALGQSIPIELIPGEALLKIEAEGEALATPDVMTIEAGVITTGQSAREALAANAALANRLIDAVRANGVVPADVRTSELSIDPQFEDTDRPGLRSAQPRIVGYIARNRLKLNLRDLQAAPRIVDSLFAAGANEVNGPTFSLADPTPSETAARRAAIANASAQASAYADALGMRITRILRVSQRNDFDREDRDYIVVTGSANRPTPIEPGQVKTSVAVWIDYAMTPQ